MAKKENKLYKFKIISLFFSLILLALLAFFNSSYSNITGMTFIGNVIDKGQMIAYGDSGIIVLIVSFAILAIVAGSIIIPKYIKNIGMILDSVAFVIILITVIDLLSYKVINLRLIGNFVIASFLFCYGAFILKKKVFIS